MVAAGARTGGGGELSRDALPPPFFSSGDGLGLGATAVDVAWAWPGRALIGWVQGCEGRLGFGGGKRARAWKWFPRDRRRVGSGMWVW